ncbi:response regulator [Vibrio ostreicida]|uniref:response regulator n=1 Tax=Vibrio ostreicida TaxID=526588 RepID=UPI003B5CFCF2
MINSSGESLLKLINNVLDMSKMDQGKQQKESEAFFFNELIDRSKKLFAHFEKKQDVEVFFSVSCEKNYKIQSDKAKIVQIINNLGYNAFKFTHRGHVDIHLSLDRDSIMSHLVIKVKDTGIGMSSELLDKVFDEFTQADNSMSRPYRGTGLGLSICQSLTRVLGGTIRAHSVLDVGSEFVVDLPVEVVDEKALFPPDRKTPSVRVISEHRYAKQLIMTELMSVGVFDHEGDIVLYYASEMDSVKNDHPLEHNPSIIYGDVSLNKTAPNQAVRLSKPYDLFGLLNCLMTMTSADEGQPTPSATLPKIDRFSVLLVEDIHLNQVVARKMLTMFNAEVSAVNNGKECLDALEHQQFDIIFMDIQMPVMDGLEAIRFIKERNLAPGTPILALTANTFESDVQTYLDQGFDDVLPKPFKLEWMRELIVKYRVNT